jgi:DNA-binding beta-propeller fold protein YncE
MPSTTTLPEAAAWVTPAQEPAAAKPAEAHVLALQSCIPLPLVEGRMDHMAIDLKRNVLYVAALANDTVESIDLTAQKVLAPRTGMKGPAGIVYVADSDELIVANGGNGDLDVIRGDAPAAEEPKADPAKGDAPLRGTDKAIAERSKSVRKVHVGDDADNLRFDPVTRRVVVGVGSGSLMIVRTDAWLVAGLIALGGHPESFQLSANGKRAWVNVPGKNQIGVVDLVLNRVEKWIDVKAAKQNYPMALFEAENRLLVGCREPGRLLVIDTETNATVADLPLSGDVDDIFVDAERGLVYASCGEGFIDVFEHVGPGTWKPKEKIGSAPGARTCLFVPETRTLYLAVPHRGEQRAELRVYAAAK